MTDNNDELHTVEIHLEVLNEYLNGDYNELCINKPFELCTYTHGHWEYIQMPELDYQWCEELSRLVANFSGQPREPIISAELPARQRIEITLPPVTETPSITIRLPSKGKAFTLEEIISFGSFERTQWVQTRGISGEVRAELNRELTVKERTLLELFKAKDVVGFLCTAVLEKQNIFFVGETGSGKTALMNALGHKIPEAERLITVEDTRETRLPHRNQVNLKFTRSTDASEKLRVKGVLASTLRQFPSRVLLAEIRGDEAYFFFQNVVNSGHPGTMASFHANSPKMAFRRMANMIQASPEGSQLSQDLIIKDLYMLINIVIQCERDENGKPYVSQIYYDPEYAIQVAG
ncbi:P-type DNA transfer ATPase VirB11 [Pseudomonas putida]|uniref:Type IV secretion system protein n=1 Tax=Pseudomonas putida TaxID=303 RepID=A0A1L7NQ41_PSEPU|nr:P-type DNA transfer ATPase VirB11 [Pseudomonas putida]BAW27563.1 DNA transfer ATPase VirB11 [Pseudomonas putida]